MKKYLSLLILLVSLSSIYAQAINITGKVVDGVGRGLSSVTVKLVAKNISTVTDANGSFSIINTVYIISGQPGTTYLVPSFENGVLHFYLDKTQKVKISFYDIKGRLTWMKGNELEPGDYNIITPMQIYGTHIILRRIDHLQYFHAQMSER